jgi:hypothetical protein
MKLHSRHVASDLHRNQGAATEDASATQLATEAYNCSYGLFLLRDLRISLVLRTVNAEHQSKHFVHTGIQMRWI